MTMTRLTLCLVCPVLLLVSSCQEPAVADSKDTAGQNREFLGGEPSVGSPDAAKEPTRVNKSNEEWREQLSAEAYRVAREGGTEPAFGDAYDQWKKEGEGVYSCACCKAELFSSNEKFDARCGWPAFYDPSKAENVKLLEDRSHGMVRVEVQCAVCDAHLGHVFKGEGFDTPTDQRFCINAVSLTFTPKAP